MKSGRAALLILLALGVLLAPFAAEAQQAGKVYRIAILGNVNNPAWEALRQTLRDLGYVEGRNVTMDWRWSEGRTDRLPGLALEVVARQPDIIIVAGIQAAQAAKQATSAIPIVGAVFSYPDKVGLVQSLARPGGNITGLSNLAPELAAKKLELLKEITPKVSRVAIVWNPANPVDPSGLRKL
jgi:putative ABC transport system substrate-binding protein